MKNNMHIYSLSAVPFNTLVVYEYQRHGSQDTVQTRAPGEAEMTAFIKASVAADRTSIRKKKSLFIIYSTALSIIVTAQKPLAEFDIVLLKEE